MSGEDLIFWGLIQQRPLVALLCHLHKLYSVPLPKVLGKLNDNRTKYIYHSEVA